MKKSAISLKDVSKKFRDFSIKNLNFDVKRGYVTGFIGPNGAGKTTTIKMIMGLLKKDSGSIKVFNQIIEESNVSIKSRIGFVSAESHFYNHLTVDKTRKFISGFFNDWDDEIFIKNIKKFNLPLDRKIKHLSTGMKVKLSLCIALSHHAELIIMDEPTSGLDPVFRDEILELLSEYMIDDNKTIFFSTHITQDLEQIADYIVFIYDGKIIINESKESLLDKCSIIKGDSNILNNNTEKFLLGLKKSSFGFEALSFKKNEMLRKLGDDIHIEKPTLNQIIVYMDRELKKVGNTKF